MWCKLAFVALFLAAALGFAYLEYPVSAFICLVGAVGTATGG